MAAPMQQRFHKAIHFLQDLFCPQWRWMMLIFGTWCLFSAVAQAAPATGTLLWEQGPQALAYGIGAFACLWVASRPTMPQWLRTFWVRVPTLLKWRGWRGCVTMLLLIITWHSTTSHLSDLFNGNYHTDAIAFVHMDADLVLQGKNPYLDDAAFWGAIQRWPDSLATPMLHSTHFGDNPRIYPRNSRMKAILQEEVAHPAARSNDFDPATVHNYPAGIIWFAVPFVWAGLPSVLWLNLLALGGILWLILSRARREDGPVIALTLLISPVFVDYSLFSNFDIVCTFFILAAWHWLPQQRNSAILLGIACAIKQQAWFVAPFYLVEVIRREGWLAALKRVGWMLGTFVVLNLPYIVTSPGAWLHSILVPMTDPLLPMGIGPITLALSGLIPFGPASLWTGMVVLVLVGLLIFQWQRPAITHDGIFLGFVVFWFSWRSLPNYLAVIPFLVAWVAVQHIAKVRAIQQAEFAPALTDEECLSEFLQADMPEPKPELVGAS